MKRSAFTRTDVVVAIVILCVLAGLVLPAIQMGPNTGARRAECINHLKQISLACQNHEGTHKVLPNSGYDRGSANSSIPTFLSPDLLPARAIASRLVGPTRFSRSWK
jgi:type II secretory pathway pseudopilin PulG